MHTLSIENHHDFIWVPEIYPPYTFSRVCSSEVEMKRFPNFYKYFYGFSKNLCRLKQIEKYFSVLEKCERNVD